jgi:hypothetical protein
MKKSELKQIIKEEINKILNSPYEKYMKIYNLVKSKGKLNKYENGWVLGDVEIQLFDGGMTRKIKYGDFRAVMNYDNNIEYMDGSESNLDGIIQYLNSL